MSDSKKRRKVTASEELRRFIDIEAQVDSEDDDVDEWSSDGEG